MKRFLPVVLLLALPAGGCVTLKPRSKTAGAEVYVLEGLRVEEFGVQRCGAGSLSAVLDFFGDPIGMEALDQTLPKAENGGVLSLDLLLEARARGFDARLVEGTSERITEALQLGLPVILMLRMVDLPGGGNDLFHYVVVDGVDPARGRFRVHFGDGKERWTSLKRLHRAWEGAGKATLLVSPRSTSGSPVDPAALRSAVALEAAGRARQAASIYRRLTEEEPPTALVWTNLGNAEAAQGRGVEAESAYRRALQLDPGYRDALNNLAWLLLTEGERLGEAEELARRAVEQGGPDGHRAWDTLARVLLAGDRCREAIGAFNRALAEAPAQSADRPWLYLGLGRSQAACGRMASARKSFEISASEATGNEALKAAKRAIAELGIHEDGSEKP